MEYIIPNRRFFLRLDRQDLEGLQDYLSDFNGNCPGRIYYTIKSSSYFTVCVVQSFEDHEFTRVMEEVERASNLKS